MFDDEFEHSDCHVIISNEINNPINLLESSEFESKNILTTNGADINKTPPKQIVINPEY